VRKAQFIGRQRELADLRWRQGLVERDGEGVAVAIRGRRQAGKSRLVEQFCVEAGLPRLYFQASRGVGTAESLELFMAALRVSDLPGAGTLPNAAPRTWLEAFELLALALPHDRASVVVVDEIPWLFQQDARLEGYLQTAWDRLLRSKPVLMLLVGSDLHMMEAFVGYDRPFYGRADSMVVKPLDPADTARLTGLEGADALDAHLITGGFPGLCRTWDAGASAAEYFAEQCRRVASPLFTIGEQMLDSEFPQPDQTRRVFSAIGSGERTFGNIAAHAGRGPDDPIKSGSLGPILNRLQDKHAIAFDQPLGTRPGNGGKLYRVADSYLRLYLGVLAAAHEEVKRDRHEQALQMIERRWESWRGRAIEPVVREALARAAASDGFPWPETVEVGGWWPRSFDPEIDLVGADRAPVARSVFFTGSIKWLGTPFDHRDMHALGKSARAVPGASEDGCGTVVVSRSGVAEGVAADLTWGPHDILAAWQ
jgi:AAA+ ATPase superfamily predicted ATPase